MNELSVISYECGCTYRFTLKRELYSATMCNKHALYIQTGERVAQLREQISLIHKK